MSEVKCRNKDCREYDERDADGRNCSKWHNLEENCYGYVQNLPLWKEQDKWEAETSKGYKPKLLAITACCYVGTVYDTLLREDCAMVWNKSTGCSHYSNTWGDLVPVVLKQPKEEPITIQITPTQLEAIKNGQPIKISMEDQK